MPERKRASTFERVQRIIAETLTVAQEQVTPHARFREDLGADSLDIVELTLALEREFEADVLRQVDPNWTETLDAYLNQIATVGQLAECLELLAPLCCTRPMLSQARRHERELEFRANLWQSSVPQEKILALLLAGKLPQGDAGWLA